MAAKYINLRSDYLDSYHIFGNIEIKYMIGVQKIVVLKKLLHLHYNQIIQLISSSERHVYCKCTVQP